MNIASIQAMIEQQTEHERHQFYAGSYGFIIELNNRLTAKRMALGQKMIEAGITELELEQERTES